MLRVPTVVVMLTVAAPLLLAQGTWPPDHSKANIDGREGMLFFPTDEEGEPIADPRNCVVQFAPIDALETRFTYSCREWFLPPEPGAYRTWIELEGRVSGAQTLLREPGDTPFKGAGFLISHETVPAGYITLAQRLPAGHTVRYLHLDQPGYGFSLRVGPGASSTPAPIPPGRVFAGIYKETEDEAVALARPVVVERGKTSEVRIDPPQGRDLLVLLRKPPRTDARTGAKVRAHSGTTTREADVLNESLGWIVAAWYGLPAATVEISVDGFALEDAKIALPDKKVTTIRQELARKK